MKIDEGSVHQIKNGISGIESTLCTTVIYYVLSHLAVLIIVLKVVAHPYSWATRAMVPLSLSIMLVSGSFGISIIYDNVKQYKNLLDQLDRAKHKYGADGRARIKKMRSIIMWIFLGLLFVYAFVIFGYIVIVAMSI